RLVPDIAKAERAADAMAPGARRGRADNRAVAIDRLLMIDHRRAFGIVVEGEADQALRLYIALALLFERGLADEIRLVPPDHETQTRLDWGVLVRNVVAPMAIRLLDPRIVHRVHAGGGQAKLLAGFPQALEHMGAELGRNIE